MFGYGVSSGTVIAEGVGGKVYRFDVSERDSARVTGIQLMAAGAVYPKLDSPVQPGGLYEMVTATGLTVYAYRTIGSNVDVFLSAQILAADPQLEINIEFFRRSQYAAAPTEFVDIPVWSRNLAEALLIREAHSLTGNSIPFSIRERIRSQAAQHGLTSLMES